MNIFNEIESNKINKDQLLIYFIGQSGYVIKSKYLTIYIDPYLTNYIEDSKGMNNSNMQRNYSPPIDPRLITRCDAIICTHSHADHMDPWTLNQIKTEFLLFASIGAISKSQIKIPKSRVKLLYPENSSYLDNIILTPFKAAHYKLSDNQGRPDCLSILLQWKNKSLFFWGDGITYKQQHRVLSKFNFDYFFAPINGRDKDREKVGIIGNISEYELANICNTYKIKNIIPNHYDMFDNNSGSIDIFKKEVKKMNSRQSIIRMECGDKIEIQKQ